MNPENPLEQLSRSELIRRLQALESRQVPLYAAEELAIQQAEIAAQAQQLRDMQEELEVSRDRYAELYDFAPIGYCTLDSAGVIREINLTGAQLLGLDRAHLIGQPLRPFVHAEDNTTLFEHLRRCRESHRQTSCELRLTAKNGRTFPAQLTSHAANDAEQETPRYHTAITDLSEHHRVEEERRVALLRESAARSAAETRDQLIAMVSHELRTPLAAVLLWARILQIKLAGQPEQARALEVILRSAESQRQLIEDLLDISRITTGKLRLEPSEVTVAALVATTLESVRPAVSAKGVAIEEEVDDDVTSVWADPDRLRQVLWNLLTNAVKFTPSGGVIRISARRFGAELDLRVADSGQGIDPTLLPHVFEAFRQSDSPITTRSHGGLGLGLAITKQLVEQHGGTIHARSDGIGKGATFVVRLPLRQPSRGATGGQSSAAVTHAPTARGGLESRDRREAAALSGIHVLLVEDEAATRSALQVLISAAGAQVQAVDTAQAAIEAFESARPDVLVGDIGMPGVDGYQMMQRLRDLERSQARAPVPALALTAFASVADYHRARAAGFDRHMSKPVEPVKLLTTLQQMACRRSAPKRDAPSASRGA